MFSVVSFCRDAEKTDDFSRQLIDSENQIWWGLHVWQDVYKPSGFIDSVRENDNNSLEHWYAALLEHGLTEVVYPAEF